MTRHKKTKTNVWEIAGWAGVLFIAGSYSLLALGILDSLSPTYHVLVLIGSIFVAVISYIKHALQPFVLNILFAFLAFIALARIVFL